MYRAKHSKLIFGGLRHTAMICFNSFVQIFSSGEHQGRRRRRREESWKGRDMNGKHSSDSLALSSAHHPSLIDAGTQTLVVCPSIYPINLPIHVCVYVYGPCIYLYSCCCALYLYTLVITKWQRARDGKEVGRDAELIAHQSRQQHWLSLSITCDAMALERMLR